MKEGIRVLFIHVFFGLTMLAIAILGATAMVYAGLFIARALWKCL